MSTKLNSEDYLNGQLLLIEKPLEWTSFDAVNKIRNALKRELSIRKIKVGHAGTLDPLASGLLLICTGKFTKRINELMGMDKVYTGSITLGGTTPSYDLESDIDQEFPTAHITNQLIEEVLPRFHGEIMQRPPLFSAIKKGGERAYELARRGEDTELPARQVKINYFKITSREADVLHFEVSCGKGTYIRSLAHDLGQALQSGAYLSALRRTKIGKYSVENAISPQVFAEGLKD